MTKSPGILCPFLLVLFLGLFQWLLRDPTLPKNHNTKWFMTGLRVCRLVYVYEFPIYFWPDLFTCNVFQTIGCRFINSSPNLKNQVVKYFEFLFLIPPGSQSYRNESSLSQTVVGLQIYWDFYYLFHGSIVFNCSHIQEFLLSTRASKTKVSTEMLLLDEFRLLVHSLFKLHF